MLELYDQVLDACQFIRSQWNRDPHAGIILGTGLGTLVEQIEVEAAIDYQLIPHFPKSTAISHRGRLVCGNLCGLPVMAMEGRFHMYEGYALKKITLPVRVMKHMGAQMLIVSNAAGGMNPYYRLGDIVVIEDHINLMGQNPLTGALEEGDDRFPDMSEAYDALLRKLMREAAPELSVTVHEGVYAGLSGPSYETRAEIRMLERLGADAVGMSTVPEVIVARAVGMRVAAVSCIANVASGLSSLPVSHTEVLDTTGRVSDQFVKLIRALVRAL